MAVGGHGTVSEQARGPVLPANPTAGELHPLAAPKVQPLDMSAARRDAASELHRLDLSNPGRSAFPQPR